MRVIRLDLKKYSYDILCARGAISSLGKVLKELNLGDCAYIITNPLVKSRFAKALLRPLRASEFQVKFKVIPDTEKSKSLETVTGILKDIARYDRKKRIFIIALGGGVIGDVSGFVASIYKRGIPYIQIPTTLLAQVDSSIGGKTAVDLTEGKNLVGAFYQPRLVLSDINFLETLDSKQIRSGLAEVIKYAVIKDRVLFLYLEKKIRAILKGEKSVLEFIVARCGRIKAGIVEKDEREEKGLRTILNFGHTMGHAIEAASKYKSYNHGEAVALGMLIETQISNNLGLIDESKAKRIASLILAAGLPSLVKGITPGAIIQAHYRDKKFMGKKNRFVLLTDIGRTKIVENVPLGEITAALLERIKTR